MTKSLSYKDSGVDITAGNAFIGEISDLAHTTSTQGVLQGLGGFGGLFDLKPYGFTDPILVSGTDGVGTKLLLANALNKHDTIGIDLVAMCVNDVLAQGAKPLFFLDYFATGRLDIMQGKDILAGISEGCRQAGCALIGGETAEMPDMYQGGHYDLAGFTVGAVEREQVLPRPNAIQAGDLLIGLASSGPHSNGYSLIRKIVAHSGLAWTDPAPFATNQSLGDAFLTPTRIYVAALMPLINAELVKGFAHITGGGLVENIPRILPDNLIMSIDWQSLKIPDIFTWLQDIGNVTAEEMRRTFNMGIGGVIICAPDQADEILNRLGQSGQAAHIIGVVNSHG